MVVRMGIVVYWEGDGNWNGEMIMRSFEGRMMREGMGKQAVVLSRQLSEITTPHNLKQYFILLFTTAIIYI